MVCHALIHVRSHVLLTWLASVVELNRRTRVCAVDAPHTFAALRVSSIHIEVTRLASDTTDRVRTQGLDPPG